MKTKKQIIKYRIYKKTEDLPLSYQELVSAAREVMKFSLSPLSGFGVGAAVRLENGTIESGSNQELASFGLSLCAERNALARVSSLGMQDKILHIAISGCHVKFKISSPVFPCGGCRQVIKEYEKLSNKKFIIITSGQTGDICVFKGIDSLLPFGRAH